MAKKRRRTKAKINKSGKQPAERQSENQVKNSPDEENPFDFGGLPKRDLKKNLGCG